MRIRCVFDADDGELRIEYASSAPRARPADTAEGEIFASLVLEEMFHTDVRVGEDEALFRFVLAEVNRGPLRCRNGLVE